MSDEAEDDPVIALVKNFQRKEVFFEKHLFIKPKVFSLKLINADEVPLMRTSTKSASALGLLETSRVLAQGYAPAPRIIPAEGCWHLLSCGPNRLVPDSPQASLELLGESETFPRI